MDRNSRQDKDASVHYVHSAHVRDARDRQRNGNLGRCAAH